MPHSQSDFNTLTRQLLADYWRLHPVQASQMGAHTHDALLPDWSADGQAARRAWREEYATALRGFDDADLDASQRLDKRVALAQCAFYEIQDDWRYAQRAPAYYVEQALTGLNGLLARPDLQASQDEQDERVLARLAAIPTLLTQGQANLRAELVAPEFVDIGRVAVRGALGFIEGLTLPDRADSEDIRRRALAALTDYRQFMETGLAPGGTFATGPELFERILREYFGLNLTPNELYQLGEATTADLQSRMAQLARRIAPGQTWQAIVEGLKTDHPTREGLLQAYADEAARAREFVVTHKLVDIPPGESCEIRPTPAFMRATAPLGYFNMTPPFAQGDNLGILYITPIDPSLPASRQEELLSAHCYTFIRSICFHETYPGHHYQFWWSKLKATPIRNQFPSTLYAEGWALYTEELMEETGFFETPTLSLWQLKNSMWRAVRIMIDVGLHTGRLSLDAAAQLLVDQAGLEPNTARGEVLRYTTSPTQPSSYMLGRNRVLELRQQYKSRVGSAFTLLDFHSRLLDYSSVSPAFIPDGLGQA